MTRGVWPACKGHPRHQRMPRQGSPAWLAMARDNVDNTRRNACFLDQLAKFQHRGTGMFGRLEHNGIARCKGRTNLDRHQKQLRIPRHHSRDHAQWLPPGEHKHVGLINRQRLATDLICTAREKVEELCNVFRLPAGFLEHLAGIDRFRPPQPFRMIRQ